ncbi:trigger factor [Atribacter laminatus]|uniref:Trigger factor n=1 Tax=Atribacter laminatus TaxID=2847778 RepID=A0A7T1AJA3_ATRLM|nr:trigger factor [Atribacter laminatus]QPM66950.1 Trigger factor [Atribacter laminatus]
MVQFKKEEKEKHLYEYEITIEEEKVQEKLENIYKEASLRVAVPGFRKGKAPRAILKGHLNQNFIKDELARSLVPDALSEVIKEEKLTLFGEPDIDLVTVDEVQPLVFKALILEKPQTTLANLEDIEIRKHKVVIRDSDVDKEIEGIQKSRGTWKEKEDLPAETGDMVKVKIDDKEYAVMAGFAESESVLSRAVIGLKKSETGKFRPQETEVGKPAEEMEFTVTEVMRKEIPELNEEFLTQLNPELKTIDELRLKTRESLEKWAEDLVQIRMEKEAVAVLAKKSEIAVPSVLVDHEAKHQIDHFIEHIKKDGMTLERYMEITNTDFESIEKDFRKQALWQLKKMFVLQEYADKNSISVGEEEMKEELGRIAQRAGKEVEDVKQILEKNNKMDDLMDQKLQQKLILDILQKVKVKEMEEPLNIDQWKALEDPEEEMME